MSLIAQTAPSPTVNAPPPRGAGAPFPSGIRATTRAPRGSARALVGAVCAPVAEPASAEFPLEVALTRVTVFEAKLPAQIEPPEGTTTSAGESFAGEATLIADPAALPERTSIRRTVPWLASPTKR